MLQAFALAALTLSGKVQVWQLLALSTLLGIINAFDTPARQALVIHLASEEDLINAISLNSATFNLARVVGPAVAGLVVAAVGEGMCFLLNGVSFIAVIACLLAMRLPPMSGETTASPIEHLVDGFRYAWREVAVRRVLGLMAASTLASMPVLVLAPFFADDIFHRDSRALGFLMGAMGIGAVAGTLALARTTRLTRLPRVMTIGGIGMGVTYLVFAFSPWFYLSLAVMPLIGYSLMSQMASANTTVQTRIHESYRGRVMALYSMTVVGLGPFGSLASGALAGRFGPRAAVAAGGVVALAAAAAYGWKVRRDVVAV
jgi:predicted MFS family arabinose efflux permease